MLYEIIPTVSEPLSIANGLAIYAGDIAPGIEVASLSNELTGEEVDPVQGQFYVKDYYFASKPYVKITAPLVSQSLAGEGTQASPFLISTAAELGYMRDQVNAGGTIARRDGGAAVTASTAHYKLTANIALNDTSEWISWGKDTDNLNEWTPIGTDSSHSFNSVFDGDGKDISGLYYSGSARFVGLFGYVGGSFIDDCIVSNVNVKRSYLHSNFTGASSNYIFGIGGVVGNNYGDIINCKSTNVAVSANTNVNTDAGGVVGFNEGNVTGCSSIGIVLIGSNSTGTDSNAYAGGIVGNNYNGTITDCISEATVTASTSTSDSAGYSYAGGIVGYNNSGSSITNSSSSGDVFAGTSSRYNANAGGVAGYNGGAITACHHLFTGDVNAITSGSNNYANAGGVVGKNSNGAVINCSNTTSGTVTASTTGGNGSSSWAIAGGVVGDNAGGGTITNCFNTGSVIGTSSGNYGPNVGGVVGSNMGDITESLISAITNCYNTGRVSANVTGTGQATGGGTSGTNAPTSSTNTNCYSLEGCRTITYHGQDWIVLPESQMKAAANDTGAVNVAPNWTDDLCGDSAPDDNLGIAMVDALNAGVAAYNATAPAVRAKGWVQKNGENGGYPYFVEEPVKLTAPTNLVWGSGATAGTASWGAVTNASSYLVQLYKVGTPDTAIGNAASMTTISKDFASVIETEGSGSYCFKVKAVGDGTTYSDSDWSAASANYDYVAPTYSISLSQSGTHTFTTENFGYADTDLTPLSVTVNNTGNQPTGALSVALSGTNADSFTLSKASFTGINAGGSDSFTVAPNTGLGVGTYTATVTVSTAAGNGNAITAQSFSMSFTVNAAAAVPLTAPTNLVWGSDATAGTASWGAVTNASSYLVQLYKVGTPDTAIGNAASMTTISKDFASVITANGNGSYYFKVKAVGDGTAYSDSDWSAPSANYNYTAPLVTQYTISVSASPAAGGIVYGGGTFDEGNRTVRATAATNYVFVRWTENNATVSTSANYTFVLTANRTLVAEFRYNPPYIPPYIPPFIPPFIQPIEPDITIPVTGDRTVQAIAEVTDDTVEISITDSQLNTALGSGTDEIIVDVTSLDGVSEITIPTGTISTITKAGDIALTVKTKAGSVTLDAEALDTVNAASGKFRIVIEEVPQSKLDDGQLAQIGEDAVVLDLQLWKGSTQIHDFNGGSATVGIPYIGEPVKGMIVWRMTTGADGKTSLEPINVTINRLTGCYEFTTDRFSEYVLAYFPFTDIDSAVWYYENTVYAYMNGLFEGTSTTTFEPETAMSRAMFVTVLWRIEGEPVATKACSFTDLTQDWYKEAVVWAAENKIVEGYNVETFGPGDPLTCEQAVTILYRYTKNYKGYDVSAADSLAAFTDTGKISDYALPAVKWAVAEDIIQGVSVSEISLSGTAKRAQLAAILQRFIEDFVK